MPRCIWQERDLAMSRLLINEPPLMVLPSLAVNIGLNEAIFVQQLHYLLQMSQNKRDGVMWVYNTFEDWGAIFPFWSIPTIKRIASSLKAKKLIVSSGKYNRMKMDKTQWYSLNYNELNKLTLSKDQIDTIEVSNCNNGEYQNDTMSSYQNDTTNNHKNKTTTKTTNKRVEQAPSQSKFNALNELINLGANEQHAKDWLSSRKKKLTQTALSGLIRETEKGGITIAQAVEACAERGWESYQSHYNLGAPATKGKTSSHDLSKQDYSNDEDVIPQFLIDAENERLKKLGAKQ